MGYPRRSFEDVRVDIDDPAGGAFAITPSDQAAFDPPTRGIYVGTGGNVTVMMLPTADGDAPLILFTAVPSGYILPIRVIKVMATGTGASNMVGLY